MREVMVLRLEKALELWHLEVWCGKSKVKANREC
jgi:hypothetical protein